MIAPGNELRGYYLQPPNKRLPVGEFFKPDRFVRSTSIGGMIMATALGSGTLITGPATTLFSDTKAFLDREPVAKTMVALWAVQHLVSSNRHTEMIKTQHDVISGLQKNI